MKKAQIISVLAGLLIVGSTFMPWLEAENLDLIARGIDLPAGMGAALVGVIAILFGLGTLIRRNKQALISNDIIASLLVFTALAQAFWWAPQVLSGAFQMKIEMDEWIVAGWGYYLAMLGGVMLTFAAAVAYGARPEYDVGTKVLRVEARWKDSVIKEHVLLEPRAISVGKGLRNDFVVPEAATGARYVLFKPDARRKNYSVHLNADLDGEVCIDRTVASVKDYVQDHTANKSGANPVGISDDDFGHFKFGPIELVFRFVRPEKQIVRVPLWKTMDRNVVASSLVSTLLQVSFLMWALLSWDETAVRQHRNQARQMLQVAVEVEMQEDEELLDMGEEEDDVGKKAAGDEGKFGDPDEDPNKESKVPKRDGQMVDKIDPKKIGLNDLLSSDKLGGAGAISQILAANSDGLSNKLAVAMSGSGSEFVMGFGSGGLGFTGTGTGGGGSGYGRIHGLGKIDTGGGTGVRASLGKKRTRKVKMRIGSGKTAGFCSKKNITNVVRRRAGAIRACYEDRLQVKPKLEGKLVVRWRIELDGRVGTASTVSSSVGDSKVESCVLRVIRRMRFQKPDGGVCVIQWPFVFRSG